MEKGADPLNFAASSGDLPRAEERYGSRALRNSYTCDHGGVRRLQSRRESGPWATARKFVKGAFLPHGYPESVSDDYLTYQIWDTVQAFCSSITGTLATLAILKGVGVGDSSATPLAATVTWMLKDGTGMLGRILFAWMQGTDLDSNAKQWRLVADVLNDLGTFLELLAPLFPSFFLAIVCAASVSRAIVGIAGVATRAALVQHQARRDNMADVAAKDNSQETMVNLAALLVNLVLTPLVAGKTVLVWSLFLIFTFFHLLANYKAVSVVKMETLNQNRLHTVMSDLLSSGKVPDPASTNAREPIVLWNLRRMFSYKMGSPLSQVLLNESDYGTAVNSYQKGQKFIVKFQRAQKRMAVALHEDCEVADQLQAALVFETLSYIAQHKSLSTSPLLAQYSETIRNLRDADDSLVGFVQSVMEEHFPGIVASLQRAGWVTSHHLLGVDEWRYTWQSSDQHQRKNYL